MKVLLREIKRSPCQFLFLLFNCLFLKDCGFRELGAVGLIAGKLAEKGKVLPLFTKRYKVLKEISKAN